MSISRFLSIFLACGATIALGALSFCGMYQITTSWLWCTSSFVLALAIEGEIFWQNIEKAVEYLLEGSALEHYVIFHQLKNEIKDAKSKGNQENIFLQDYALQKNDPVVRKKMRSTFLRVLNGHTHTPSTEIEDAANKLIVPEKESILTKIKWGNRFLILGWAFSIACGIAIGLTTLSSIYEVLPLMLAISAPAMYTLIAGIALLAGLGYMLMMYCTCLDIFEILLIQKWVIDIDTFFTKPKLKDFLSVAWKVLLLGLVIFSTIATAGTWLIAAKHGAALTGWFSEKAANIIRWVTVMMGILPSTLFDFTNSLESISGFWSGSAASVEDAAKSVIDQKRESKEAKSQLVASTEEKNSEKTHSGGLKGKLNNIYSSIGDSWKREGFVQFFNPMRLVVILTSSLANVLVFVGHIVSIGVSSDRIPGVNPLLTTLVGSFVEACTDYHYLFHEDGEASESQAKAQDIYQHSDACKNSAHVHKHVHHKDEEKHAHAGCGHSHDDEKMDNGHHHADIVGFLLILPLLIPRCIAVIWDYLFSAFSPPEEVKMNWNISVGKFFNKNGLTLKYIGVIWDYISAASGNRDWNQSVAKFFKKTESKMAKFSNAWKKQEIIEKLDNETNRYKNCYNPIFNEEITTEKYKALVGLKSDFASLKTDNTFEGEAKKVLDNSRPTLLKTRNRFFGEKTSKSTHACVFLDQLSNDYFSTPSSPSAA